MHFSVCLQDSSGQRRAYRSCVLRRTHAWHARCEQNCFLFLFRISVEFSRFLPLQTYALSWRCLSNHQVNHVSGADTSTHAHIHAWPSDEYFFRARKPEGTQCSLSESHAEGRSPPTTTTPAAKLKLLLGKL